MLGGVLCAGGCDGTAGVWRGDVLSQHVRMPCMYMSFGWWSLRNNHSFIGTYYHGTDVRGVIADTVASHCQIVVPMIRILAHLRAVGAAVCVQACVCCVLCVSFVCASLSCWAFVLRGWLVCMYAVLLVGACAPYRG